MLTLYPTCMWTCVYSGNAIQFFYKLLSLLQPQVMATACIMHCHWLFVVQNVSHLLLDCLLPMFLSAMIDALSHIYFSGSNEQCVQMLTNIVHEAIHLGVWGRDLHLFPLSLLLNRPIFSCNTFYRTRQSVRILNLSDTVDPHHLARRFASRDQGTSGHYLFCSDVLRVSLSSGSIASLPHPPL